MNLHVQLATENECYIKNHGTKWTPTGIMIHSTGANNPNLKRYVGPDDGLLGVNTNGNTWNRYRPDGRQICCHAFIGKLADGTIASYQILPWNCKGWNNGGSSNSTHIAIEICEDDLTGADYFAAVYREAVELAAYLCREYKIPTDRIIDHAEGHRLGIASNHGDVAHWFPRHGKSMDTFRTDVAALLAEPAEPAEPEKHYRVQVGYFSKRKNAEAMRDKLYAAGFPAIIREE